MMTAPPPPDPTPNIGLPETRGTNHDWGASFVIALALAFLAGFWIMFGLAVAGIID